MDNHSHDEAGDLTAPVFDLTDLDARWQWLVGPWGFSVPQLFGLIFGADGLALPVVINVKDEPGGPPIRIDAGLVTNLVASLGEVMEDCAPGGSVALMWARPGHGPSSAGDREVLRLLHERLASSPFRTWPLYFATDDAAGLVPADDLAA